MAENTNYSNKSKKKSKIDSDFLGKFSYNLNEKIDKINDALETKESVNESNSDSEIKEDKADKFINKIFDKLDSKDESENSDDDIIKQKIKKQKIKKKSSSDSQDDTFLDKIAANKFGILIYWAFSLVLFFIPFLKGSFGGLSLMDIFFMSKTWGYCQYYTYFHLIITVAILVSSIMKKETESEGIKKMYKGYKFLITALLIFMIFISYNVWNILSWYTQVFFILYFLFMYKIVDYHFLKYYNYESDEEESN